MLKSLPGEGNFLRWAFGFLEGTTDSSAFPGVRGRVAMGMRPSHRAVPTKLDLWSGDSKAVAVEEGRRPSRA